MYVCSSITRQWNQRLPEPGAATAMGTRPLSRSGGVYGFLMCTALWFTHQTRNDGQQVTLIIICPRATPASSTDKWIAGNRTAADVSGAFCLSSNLVGPYVPGPDFGGNDWIIEPDEGAVLGVTFSADPFGTNGY